MTPQLFYGAAFVFLLLGLGQHGIEYVSDRFAEESAKRKDQREEETVNAYFQQASNRQLYDDNQPRRLPPTTPEAAPLESTPELANPLDEWHESTNSQGSTGWH